MNNITNYLNQLELVPTWSIILGLIGIILFIIMVSVFMVKLNSRNQEIDELADDLMEQQITINRLKESNLKKENLLLSSQAEVKRLREAIGKAIDSTDKIIGKVSKEDTKIHKPTAKVARSRPSRKIDKSSGDSTGHKSE